MINDKVMEVFVRNQMCIHPDYEGEILAFRGAKYDTDKIVRRLRKTFNFQVPKDNLDLMTAFLCNCDSVGFMINGSRVNLASFLNAMRKSLPTKYRTEDFLKAISQSSFFNELETYITTSKEMSPGVYSSNLVLSEYNPEMIEKSLANLMGLKDTRFIYTRIKAIPNGNLLDLVQDDFTRMSKVKQPYSSPANMIRSMGIPYSDYRKFITYGVLVSIDENNNVFILSGDKLYCVNPPEFRKFLGNPELLDLWEKQFTKVYVLNTLTENTVLDWGLLV